MDTLALTSQDATDLDHICRTMHNLADAWTKKIGRTQPPRWLRDGLAREAHATHCEVCGVPLVMQVAHEKNRPDALRMDSLIYERQGMPPAGFSRMFACDRCHRARHGRDLITWLQDDRPAFADPARIKPLLARRAQVGLKAANHCTRWPWKSTDPVRREIVDRWECPRCVLYAAQRDPWDCGLDPMPDEPRRGWIAWPNASPPSAAAWHALRAFNAQTLPDAIAAQVPPGWTVRTVKGEAAQNLFWSLIDQNVWLRRLALPDISLNVRPGAFVEPEPLEPDLAATMESVRAALPPPAPGRIQFVDIPASFFERQQAWRVEHAAWEDRRATWSVWPPAGTILPDDDWWKSFYSVGDCTRRRYRKPISGRYRPRPPWHKPPSKRGAISPRPPA